MLTRRALLAGAGTAAALESVQAVLRQQPRVQTLYFTWSGSSPLAAREVQRLLGSSLFLLQTRVPYPEDYWKTLRIAKRERLSAARPELQHLNAAFSSFDILCIGYPIWGGYMPMALYSFLESADI